MAWIFSLSLSASAIPRQGNEDILGAVCESLMLLCLDKEKAQAVASAGGVRSAVQSVRANADMEGVDLALDFLDKVSVHAPDSMVSEGGADACVELLASNGKLVKRCLAMLEKVCSSDAGVARVVQANGLAAVIGAMGADPGVAGSAFRLLDRVVRNTQYNYADSVREAGGVDAIVRAMGFAEAAGDDKTAVNGSRILARIMAAHTDEIIAKLNAGGGDVEQMACLLASLSVQDNVAQQIVANGGIPALVALLSGGSCTPRTAEACCSALGRLAISDAAITELVQAGAVNAVCGAYSRYQDNAVRRTILCCIYIYIPVRALVSSSSPRMYARHCTTLHTHNPLQPTALD